MEQESYAPSSSAKVAGIAILLLAGLISAGAYGLHERNAAHRLSGQNDQMTTQLQQMRTEMASLKEAVATATPAPRTVSTLAPRAKGAKPAVVRRRAEDPRWKKVQAQLDQQQQDIASTRQDLSDTRTQLQGSIASTHDELVVLEKKGERNFYEFDLDKAKQFNREGPVGLRLRKANTKHQYADVELMVDDTYLSQKHVNLLQPVVFYAAEGGRPVELVINKISKNHIHGYVSEPKYSTAELAAAPAAAATPAAPAASAPAPGPTVKPRSRLPLPK